VQDERYLFAMSIRLCLGEDAGEESIATWDLYVDLMDRRRV
jgi:hypothetical protein